MIESIKSFFNFITRVLVNKEYLRKSRISTCVDFYQSGYFF